MSIYLLKLLFLCWGKECMFWLYCSYLLGSFSFFYYCSITLVPHFPPWLSPALPTPPTFNLPPVVFAHGSFIHAPWLYLLFLLKHNLYAVKCMYFQCIIKCLYIYTPHASIVQIHLHFNIQKKPLLYSPD